MNIKLALGIFLPLALIVCLVILNTANIGFSLNKENTPSIEFNTLFVGKDTSRNTILLQTITITNDFFLSKKYELPKLIVCLSDKEGIKEATNLQVKYNEGSYTRGSDVPIFDEIFFEYNSYSKQSVELPANSKKQVKVLVEPKYLYNYETEIQSYKDYDELLLIQKKNTNYYYDSYSSCRNLESEEMNTAIHIPIV